MYYRWIQIGRDILTPVQNIKCDKHILNFFCDRIPPEVVPIVIVQYIGIQDILRHLYFIRISILLYSVTHIHDDPILFPWVYGTHHINSNSSYILLALVYSVTSIG